MAEGIKVGTRVEITGKNLKGTIAYIGTTMFASGKWIGVVLDLPKGKNNGVVQGKRYFTCGENCGVFVRQQHISVISKPVTVGSSEQPSAMKLSAGETQLTIPPVSHEAPKLSSKSDVVEPPETTLSSTQMPDDSDSKEKEIEGDGQAPSSVFRSALAGGVSMAEVEMLRAQLKDWKDKFETIRQKRQADRDKLKEIEKMRIQTQQLMDFKSRMSEQHQDLLKQLRDAKKEAKEALESKERYMEEMADVHETVEMATLDKEMAEEKVETLQQEVDSLKERVEELQTDLAIMKAEIEDHGGNGTASTYQLKQLEDQNSRLKEALLRMRDLSSAEKTEHQNLEKAMEKKNKELDEMKKKSDKLGKELEKAELVIDELKEQVDAAVVAEEMVEQLTDQNLQLEEKITDYEEQIHDLETINEMNEELQENARESEMELREEVDLARSKAREADRKTEAANEVIADYQDTIKKFRRLVQDLQEANQELRQQQSVSENTEISASDTITQPSFQYPIKMLEAKAVARSIDMELRKLEAMQANEHVRYLLMFMPELFMRHGGDQDCVRVVLLVRRISKKADIIARRVTDHFGIATHIEEKQSDLQGVRGEQMAFASSLVNILLQLKILMDRYERSLSHCSVDLFQKVGTLSSEMTPHERALDVLAEQLRRDTLDETTSIDQLLKAFQFFKHLFDVHLSREAHFDCWRNMDEYIKQSDAFLQNIHINALRMKSFLKDGHETSDIAILLRDIETASSDVKHFCKKLRRRMPQAADSSSPDENLPMLKFGDEVMARILRSEDNLFKINTILTASVSECVLTLGSAADSIAVSSVQLQKIFLKSSEKVFGEQTKGYETTRLALGGVLATMNSLVTSLQEGEFDTSEKRPKIMPAIEKRAQLVKAEITDSEGLATKLADKDTVIQELRKSLKMKAAEIGETKIRIGMLERKLEKSGKVGEEQLSRLQQENDNLKDELKRKEREYDETLDTLQGDIDTLEYEKSELKQRLMAQAKRMPVGVNDTSQSDMGRPASIPSSIATILQGADTSSGTVPGRQVVVTDSPLMQQQIQALQIALNVKRADNFRLMGKNLSDRMKKLGNLKVKSRENEKNDETAMKKRNFNANLGKLHTKLEDMKTQIFALACPTVIDITKKNATQVGSKSFSQQLVKEQLRLQVTKEKVLQCQIEAFKLMAEAKIGSSTMRQFASFPTLEFTQVLNTKEPARIGSLLLPKMEIPHANLEGGRKLVLLKPEELLILHNKLLKGLTI